MTVDAVMLVGEAVVVVVEVVVEVVVVPLAATHSAIKEISQITDETGNWQQ